MCLHLSSDNPANSSLLEKWVLVNCGTVQCVLRKKRKHLLDMIFPKEDQCFWVDTLAIPLNSKNPDKITN